MVEDRGAHLRKVPFVKLKDQAKGEHVEVGGRRGTISTILLPLPSGGVQVVIQGFLKHRFLPGSSVALDGFYRYPDETIAPMSKEDFWDFD